MPLTFAFGARRHACTATFSLALALFLPSPAFAGPFTDPAAFLAAISALPGTASTLTFESQAAGTTIPSGGSMQGITFTSSIGLDMIVSTGFATTSGAHYLGVDDGGDEVFLPPTDLWEMSFGSPLQAIGLFFISSDRLVAGDLRLETAAGIATNDGTPNSILSDGGLAYFIGLVSDGGPFSSVAVRYGAGVQDFFVYNVDDITRVTADAVPEPSGVLLTTGALVALWARRRSPHAKRPQQGATNA